jgi:prepilin signal peptidase PulO-like enzyme (type II secretory pathway)
MLNVPDPLPPGALHVFVAVLGLIFGSFVTALTYRLPRGISIAKGRSACPACGTALTARDLIPVFSWLMHRGACRMCGTRVSWRYPAIEVLMAALFVLAAVFVRDHVRLIIVLTATPVMAALAVIDIEHRRLPNVLTACLAVAALAFRYVTDADFVSAAVSAAAIFAFAVLLDHVGRRLIRQGLGMGDAKLMSVVALALPTGPLLLTLGCAGCLGVVTGLVWRGGQTVGATQVPFGPAILAALWIAMVAV